MLRLRGLESAGRLVCPVIAVNEAHSERAFNDRYGTGQSAIDGILRATNVLLAGRTVVVLGYGWTGRGVALRAKGLGASVIVCEVDPLRALEARMAGYDVATVLEACRRGDVFITVTGNRHVIDAKHFEVMKDGALVSNSGHFNVEINIPALAAMSKGEPNLVRPFVEQYTTKDGRKINILGEGRLINLASAEGHPASVMDMSFANQALSAEYMAKNADKLEKKVYSVPAEIDNEIARLKLEAMGVKIDKLTDEQLHYLNSWEEGT